MSENEFEFEGVVYRAKDNFGYSCDDCELVHRPCGSAPACTPEHRRDGRNVIFVEKQP